MKKKGFTLIELLAVIVVLAVIALIATPIVLNLVKTAKIGAAEQSVTGYVKAVENTIIKDMINNKEVSDGNYKYNSIEADISGKRPTSTDTHKGIVYLDPTDLKNSCNASNSKSETGTKTGCMKWYIYAEDNNSYTMILDHNTTLGVAYNSTNSNSEMKEIKTALESDTSTWDSSLKARLITANEIAKITGNTSFDEKTSTKDKWFYLDSNNQTQVANNTNKSKYAWLFDYSGGCEKYGCNIEESNTIGYWTISPIVGESQIAWAVFSHGFLCNYITVNSISFGIRPVITVPKAFIS